MGGNDLSSVHGWTEVPMPSEPAYDALHERIELVSDGAALSYQVVRRADIPSVDELAEQRRAVILREIEAAFDASQNDNLQNRLLRAQIALADMLEWWATGSPDYSSLSADRKDNVDTVRASGAAAAVYFTAYFTAKDQIQGIVIDEQNEYPTDDEKRTTISAVTWSVP
jgi:hypothetical protein